MNFARFAFSCVSFDDKAEWASVLEPFQLSGGTSGGSEILASIDMAMSSLAPVGWVRIKLDFKSFFYRANMRVCVMALKDGAQNVQADTPDEGCFCAKGIYGCFL